MCLRRHEYCGILQWRREPLARAECFGSLPNARLVLLAVVHSLDLVMRNMEASALLPYS